MLEKLYSKSTEKDLKSALKIYTGILIGSLIIPVLGNAISYFLNGKIYLEYLIIFIVLALWSLFNVEYIKNKLKK